MNCLTVIFVYFLYEKQFQCGLLNFVPVSIANGHIRQKLWLILRWASIPYNVGYLFEAYLYQI